MNINYIQIINKIQTKMIQKLQNLKKVFIPGEVGKAVINCC